MNRQLLLATELFINPSFKISLIIDSGVCSNTKIAEALQKIEYFRKSDRKIQFYDSNANLIGQASPFSDAENNNKSSIITNLPASTPVTVDKIQ